MYCTVLLYSHILLFPSLILLQGINSSRERIMLPHSHSTSTLSLYCPTRKKHCSILHRWLCMQKQFMRCTQLYCILFYCIILYTTQLHITLLNTTALYCILRYCTLLPLLYSVLNCTSLFSTVLNSSQSIIISVNCVTK